MSNEGKKFDQNKPDMSLIPPSAAYEEAFVWTFGKKKYTAYNWMSGIMYTRILSAMERHLCLLKSGITLDYETKRHHAGAIRCCCAMIIHFDLENRKDLDDRFPYSEDTKKKLEEMAKGEFIWDILAEEKVPQEDDELPDRWFKISGPVENGKLKTEVIKHPAQQACSNCDCGKK